MANRVLYVDTLSRFMTRMDRNYKHKYEHVARTRGGGRFTMADSARTSQVPLDLSSYGILLVGVFAAIRILSDPPEVCVPKAWRRDIRHRCVLVEDTRDYNGRTLASILGGDYDSLIATYECAELLAACPSIRRSWVIPHHVNTDIYLDMGIERIYDILLYGSTNPETYPFRHRLRKAIQELPCRVKIIDGPDADQFDPACCGEGLARIINQSWITIATPSRHDYLVAKYFEASACGSVVAGRMATQGLPIWKGRYIRLDETMSDCEIRTCLLNSLRDKEMLCGIAASMSETVRQEYNLDRYVEKLTAVMDEIDADHSMV